jgi:hypothetical protein
MTLNLPLRLIPVVLTAAGALCLAQSLPPRDLGPKIFQAQWISVNTLQPDPASVIPFPHGNDPIRDGDLEVRAKGWVKTDLEGLNPQVQYTLWVCRLSGIPDNRCLALGQVTSDEKGKADAVLPWPEAAAGPHAVFFVLTRNQTSMFVSGFYMPSVVAPPAGPQPPSPPKPSTVEVDIKGEITSVGSGAFSVAGIPILVDARTRFDGRVKSFADLQTGMTAEVTAVQTSGGLLAVRVQASAKK